jgi:hypothetical protein
MMSVPAPNLSNYTIPELLQVLHDGMIGSPLHQQATFMLQFRVAEQQAQTAAQQAAAAREMVAPTQALANFTGSLVRLTRALVFFGAATLLVTIVQVVLALKASR